MPTETTPEEAAYTAACLPDRLRSAAHLGSRVHFDDPGEKTELVTVLHEAADKLEAADALLSLSARYREAHATYVEAVASERAAYLVSTNDPGLASAACTALAATKHALLSAALAIT